MPFLCNVPLLEADFNRSSYFLCTTPDGKRNDEEPDGQYWNKWQIYSDCYLCEPYGPQTDDLCLASSDHLLLLTVLMLGPGFSDRPWTKRCKIININVVWESTDNEWTHKQSIGSNVLKKLLNFFYLQTSPPSKLWVRFTNSFKSEMKLSSEQFETCKCIYIYIWKSTPTLNEFLYIIIVYQFKYHIPSVTVMLWNV